MCNTRVRGALLPGFFGPYFDGLEAVQHLFADEPQRLNEVFMSDVRKSFATPMDTEPTESVDRLISTTDGYQWTFGVGFIYYDRKVWVLVPGVLESKKKHGTHADRHVALYYSGAQLTPVELKRIIRRATAAFEDTYDRMYGHIV